MPGATGVSCVRSVARRGSGQSSCAARAGTWRREASRRRTSISGSRARANSSTAGGISRTKFFCSNASLEKTDADIEAKTEAKVALEGEEEKASVAFSDAEKVVASAKKELKGFEKEKSAKTDALER